MVKDLVGGLYLRLKADILTSQISYNFVYIFVYISVFIFKFN